MRARRVGRSRIVGRLGRHRCGQIGRRARSHLQAQHRRHARRAFAGDRSGACRPRAPRSGCTIRRACPTRSGLIDDVAWCDSPLEAVEGTDALVITTEWDIYRAMDLDRDSSAAMRGDVFFDLRNIYKPREVTRCGFRYFGVGVGGIAGCRDADRRRSRHCALGRALTRVGRRPEDDAEDPGHRRRRLHRLSLRAGASRRGATRVIGIDNLNAYYDVALKQARLRDTAPSAPGFTFHKVDIADREALRDALAGERIPHRRCILRRRPVSRLDHRTRTSMRRRISSAISTCSSTSGITTRSRILSTPRRARSTARTGSCRSRRTTGSTTRCRSMPRPSARTN